MLRVGRRLLRRFRFLFHLHRRHESSESSCTIGVEFDGEQWHNKKLWAVSTVSNQHDASVTKELSRTSCMPV
jgi:hypothetical protein